MKIWKLKNQNHVVGNTILVAAIGLTMFIVEFCMEQSIGLLLLEAVLPKYKDLTWLRALAQYGIQTVLFSSLFYALYYFFWWWYSRGWKHKNRDIYLQGEWLTIHDKETTKIGVAEIRQNFYEIAVDGRNVNPTTEDDITTSWNYIGACFDPAEREDIRLIGTYFAQRTNQASKQGVHVFREFTPDKKKKTIKMSGYFGDVLKRESDSILEEHDKAGDILFFRMSPAIKKYIGYATPVKFSARKLKNLLNEEKFQEEPFVIELKKALSRNDIKHSNRELKRKINERYHTQNEGHILIQDIDDVVLCFLKSMAKSDGKLEERELEMIHTLTGYHWTREAVRNCPVIPHTENSHQIVKAKIESILERMQQAKFERNVIVIFQELLEHICDAVIKSDGKVVSSETTYKDELISWISDYEMNHRKGNENL